jgi:hypothetical protein
MHTIYYLVGAFISGVIFIIYRIKQSVANEKWCQIRDADFMQYMALCKNRDYVRADELKTKYKDDVVFQGQSKIVDYMTGRWET